MVRCGELAQPLINLLRDFLLENGYLRMDETTVHVLNEPGKTTHSTSYRWVQESGEREGLAVFYLDSPPPVATRQPSARARLPAQHLDVGVVGS